ncbi:MAG: YegS/Rv2252/BmrU family lipid kinase [Ruminococcaceae bacterium]|nr:YegS/Rv2252/BmrU family lipid kinase [Oscillospiraceae bacterium]
METKKLLLIVNPCSGRAKMRGELLRVTEILSGGGYDVTVYPTKAKSDATEKVKSIKDGEYERIVVCGGDGTLNEVITGMMLSGINCTLGYIPAGTLNEWSTGLHISKSIPVAARDIINGSPVQLDIGKFGDKYFSYTASFGAFTEASYSAPQDIKNVLGQAAYFFEGIKSLANIKPISLQLECDGKQIEGDFLFGAISNSMSVGGIVKFREAMVKLNDGLFEVMLIRSPANISEFQSIVDGILRQDLDRKGIEFLRTDSLKVYGGSKLSWTLDGEFAEGSSCVEIKNIKRAINFIVPSTLNVLE